MRGLIRAGVEVGVWRGNFAKIILSKWAGDIYLVDAWKRLDGYKDVRNERFDPYDYQLMEENLAEYADRCHVIKHLSVEAAKFVPNELDFVYIDANHSYASVKQDIKTWFEKIRKGGILAGHDFMSLRHLGVTQAVLEFAFKRQLDVFVIPALKNGGLYDGGEASWYLIK